MSQTKKVVTPNADESQGRIYQAVVDGQTVRVRAFSVEEAEALIQEQTKPIPQPQEESK